MTWAEFCVVTPERSIALDGFVKDTGPAWDEAGLRVNFDHHSGCVREATMSTAMQIFFAIKGGLMERLGGEANVYINDPDQDTSLATWLLKHYSMFTGIQSHPVINRLLTLNDRLDITGGAFPMQLDDEVAEMHAWAFDPYTEIRVSGRLAEADESTMRSCVESVHARLDRILMGQGERRKLHKEHEIWHDSPYGYKIVNETGGNEARYWLYSQGMNSFVSRVATASYGSHVYSIGRRSKYIKFPVKALMSALNKHEDFPDVWGGSDLIGGCGRAHRSKLSWQEIRDILDSVLAHV